MAALNVPHLARYTVALQTFALAFAPDAMPVGVSLLSVVFTGCVVAFHSRTES